jgi:hypothetical protein
VTFISFAQAPHFSAAFYLEVRHAIDHAIPCGLEALTPDSWIKLDTSALVLDLWPMFLFSRQQFSGAAIFRFGRKAAKWNGGQRKEAIASAF